MRRCTLLLIALGCTITHAQQLDSIGKAKPFSWTGSIGASVNFYNSNETYYTQPPYAWNLYGNFTGNVYGVSLPVSFVINQYGKSYSNPFTQFGVSPTYKWAKLHLGYRNMVFSPLTYEGQSFLGAGVELTPGILRFSAFIGKLNKAVNEDTTSGRFKAPQYARTGYGFKLGVGNESRFFDVIFFKAKDDSGSAKFLTKSGTTTPQENAVIGSSFRVPFLKIFALTGDAAISGLTEDVSIAGDSTEAGGLGKLVGNFFNTNSSTSTAWAGQTRLMITAKTSQHTIGYRRVQPGFKSLGTPYMLNDIEAFSLNNNFQLPKAKVNISTGLALQHNNLNKKLSSQLNTTTGHLNINAILSTAFNLNLNATGYSMRQKDGTTAVNDSFRLGQSVYQVVVAPVYIIPKNNGSYTFSGSFGIGGLNDNNIITSETNENNNMSASITAGKYFTKNSLNVSLTALHNRFEQGKDVYTSSGFTAGAGIQLLKSKALSLQGSAGYLFNHYTAAQANNNFTYSFNAGYHEKKHAVNLFANYVVTAPGAIRTISDKIPYAVVTKNLSGGISYQYTLK